MLHDEYDRFARSVDYISHEQAEAAINIVLSKSKNDANAAIVELWIHEQGQGEVNVLRSYARVADQGIPNPQLIPLHDKATGFLVWIAEKKQSMWLNDIDEGVKSGKNLLTGGLIEDRYYNVYDRTRAFAGVPVIYRGQLRAILTLEVTARNRLEMSHLDALNSITEPTGILVWKASVFEANEKQTNEAINYLRQADTTFRARALNRTGFIARPFDKNFTYVSDKIIDAFRKRKVQAAEYRPRAGRPFVVEEMVEQINQAHFGIADITGLNNNVLIEVGVMTGNGMPLIVIRDKDDEQSLPFDIAARQSYGYELRGDEILIHDATKTHRLEDFVVDFIDKMPSGDFWKAREWHGG